MRVIFARRPAQTSADFCFLRVNLNAGHFFTQTSADLLFFSRADKRRGNSLALVRDWREKLGELFLTYPQDSRFAIAPLGLGVG